MKDTYTIAETFTLPSLGKFYKDSVKEIKLRSMTTEEEMRRLSQNGSPYKILCDVIDACTLEGPNVSSYDMCLGDYQFLLYKIRTVTYGSDYLNGSVCPYCGTFNSTACNLDDLKSIEYDEKENWDQLFNVTLPVTGKQIKLKIQTPHILDDIDKDKIEFEKRYPESVSDVSLLMTLKHSIELIDGAYMDPMKLELFLRKLPMKDTNKLRLAIAELNNKVGVDTTLDTKCSNAQCGKQYLTNFRINSEFFGPTV